MKNRYKVLDSLPPYGPMYIPIAADGKQFYSEGFVVRFYRLDTTEWVANFELGGTRLREVIEFNNTSNLLIIADGTCYMMDPECSVPLFVFGGDYSKVIITEDQKFVLQNSIGLTIVEPNGTYWHSQRISWDGLADIMIDNGIVKGLSYDPTHDADEWVEFSYDVNSKELIGGSYNRSGFYHSQSMKKKPWWKLW